MISSIARQRGRDNARTLERCTLCGTEAPVRAILQKPASAAGGRSVSLFCCPGCGGVYRGGVEAAYDDDLYAYYKKYDGKTFDEVYPPLNRIRCRALLDRFGRLTAGRVALDIGCGKGDFVQAALKEGWTARGIDLAEGAIAVGRKFGLPLTRQDFFSSEIHPGSQDLVTLFEVIEHVPNPADFLVRAEEVLRPGGLVYLTTPNFASLDRRLLGATWKAVHAEHLSYFTPRSLLALVRAKTSLEVVDVETRNLSVALTERLLGWRVRRPAPGSRAGDTAAAPRPAARATSARETIERSATLRGLKHLINRGLSATGLGTTLCVLLRRRPERGGAA